MKARNLGRLELLAWINEVTEADYPKVELCSDAIAFCQVLDAIHPAAGIQLFRLNFNAKNKDDFSRNLKILDDMLQKLKVNKRIQIEQMANGKFQYNMEFLQWLFDYAHKVASPTIMSSYNGYEKRLEAYKKQQNIPNNLTAPIQLIVQMSSHLIPNQSVLQPSEDFNQPMEIKTKGIYDYEQKASTYSQQQQEMLNQQLNQQIFLHPPPIQHSRQSYPQGLQSLNSNQNSQSSHPNLLNTPTSFSASSTVAINEQRKAQLSDLVHSLESELTQTLFNHKLFLEEIQQIEEERNFYYQKLRAVEEECKKKRAVGSAKQPIKQEIMAIIANMPEDFIEGQQRKQ